MSFCDCGCVQCRAQVGPHPPCRFECQETVPQQPDSRRVLGGKPGREIIRIK
jgi:hypothetical protein